MTSEIEIMLSILAVGASSFNIQAPLGRRAVCQSGAAALAAVSLPAFAADKVDAKAAAQVTDTLAAMKNVLDNKDAFIAGLSKGDGSGPTLPAPIPFTIFQKLEKVSDPEFMEAAIDYAEGVPCVLYLQFACLRAYLHIRTDERVRSPHKGSELMPASNSSLVLASTAYRGVKDLVKLAKLTKEPVVVATKEAGKPRTETQMSYGEAPGSGLASAEEYAKRAADELLGATLALDAAIKYMGKP